MDIIKGWAMLTIILFHCCQSCISGYFGWFIGNPWDVAIFFIIAGFYLKEDSLGNPVSFIKGKIKRLYIPVTIIYSIFVLLHNVFVDIGWYPLGESHPATGTPYTYYGLHEIVIRLGKVLVAGGNGELVMGAMWFVYSLLYAFVILTLLYWVICRVVKDSDKRFYTMSLCCLTLSVISTIFSNKLGITISRFSPALTAISLIWWGMIIKRRLQCRFDNWWVLGLSVVLFVHSVLMQRGYMIMARNIFQDFYQIVMGCTSFIYIIAFVGRKLEKSIIGKFLALMGRESLYLMAFHILGLFLCNSILEKIGVFEKGDDKGLYTYCMGNNWFVLGIYILCAISTTFVLLYGYRGIEQVLQKNIKK